MKKLILLLPFTLSASKPSNLTFTTESDKGGILIKAVNNTGESIGHVALDTQYHPIGYIDEIFVYPEYRNQRIGTSLMERTMQFFQDRNYCKVHLEVGPFSSSPKLDEKQLYEWYGNWGFKRTNHAEMTKYIYRQPAKKLDFLTKKINPFNLHNCSLLQKNPYISTIMVAARAIPVIEYKTGFLRNQFKK